MRKVSPRGRADQRIQTRPALVLGVGVGDLLRQGLIGVLPALILGLFGAQFGATVFAGGEQVLQFGQRRRQLLGVEIAVVLRLMIEQALIAFLQQDLGLFDGFFALLQLLAQFADLLVVDAQQVFQAAVIQFRMQGAPVGDLAAQLAIFGFQGQQSVPAGP